MALALLLEGCGVPAAQDDPRSPQIHGHITDAVTGEPLANVLVYLASTFGDPHDAVTVTSDTAGAYSVVLLQHSTLPAARNVQCAARLSFLRAGYVPQERKAETPRPCAGHAVQLDIALAPDAAAAV